ncbi:MAG: hypothetical protein LBT63_01005 [Holosporaceae bacterium]|jgi:hypothetical protein|nr:hypothetical protein [Holosporaceae bacterium]
MPYISMQNISLAIARIGTRIDSAIREHSIEMNEDDALKEALDDLKHLANVLYDAIEDESLNERK